MTMNIHDIPGEQKVQAVIPRAMYIGTPPPGGTAETLNVPIFEAPFACKVSKVTLKSGLDWLSQDQAFSAYVTLFDAGNGGTVASPLGLGTILGSAAVQGTPLRANRPTTLYAGTLDCATTRVLKVQVFSCGTVGSVAPSLLPGYMIAETTFKGN